MNNKNIKRDLQRIVPADPQQMGPTIVKQPIPAPGLRQVGPFILLHHFGPTPIKHGEGKFHVGAHPHRGFQPVTILFQGEMRHRDSLGNDGVIKAGEVQWITAGNGIIHSETVPDSFLQEGGTLEGIQLWVNLPAKEKMIPPAYQEVRAEEIPSLTKDDLSMRVIAGTYEQLTGPVKPYSTLVVGVGEIPAGGKTTLSLPKPYPLGIYLVKGNIQIADQEIRSEHMALFGEEDGDVDLKAKEDSQFLFLYGKPLEEPMAQYGPFVMNRAEEIQQAIADYQAGKMGELIE